MKLSKKNEVRQRALQKAIASGKTLAGLLVGFAATVTGCGERHSPAHTMGIYPDPRYQQEQPVNENVGGFVALGEIAGSENIAEPKQETQQLKTNEVNEVKEDGAQC